MVSSFVVGEIPQYYFLFRGTHSAAVLFLIPARRPMMNRSAGPFRLLLGCAAFGGGITCGVVAARLTACQSARVA